MILVELNIKYKFVLGIVLILTFTMLILSTVFIRQSEHLLIDALKNKADILKKNLSVVATNDLKDHSFTDLQTVINEIAIRDQEIKTLIVAYQNGQVIASSDKVNFPQFSKIGNQNILRQVQIGQDTVIIDRKLLKSTSFIFERQDETDEEKPFEKSDAPKKAIGFIYIALDTMPFEKSISMLWYYSVMITVGLIFAGIIAAYCFGASMSEPIKALAENVRIIASGNLEKSVRSERRDEIGSLVSDVDRMRLAIKDLTENLKTAEKKYRKIFEGSVEGIFQTSPEGRFISANPAIARILGYSSAEELLVSVTNIAEQLYVNPEGRKKIIANLNENKEVIGFETQLYRRDRTVIWVSISARTLYQANDNPVFMEGFLRDITERKEAEALRQAYQEKIELEVRERTRELSETLEYLKKTQHQLIQTEKIAALGQLIAGVAHEINTPLGAIRASVDNISDSISEIPEQLPKLSRLLSEDQQKYFSALISRSLENKSVLSAKEERKIKRTMIGILEEHKTDHADSAADTLTDMGVYDNIDMFLPLLRHPESDFILKTAYNLSGLRKSTQNIAVAADRASKVVFALKSYARFDSSGEKVKADLTEGIETVLTLYHNKLKHGVEIIRNYEKLPPVLCYPDELNQVWTNLIHNAIQAMEGKGILEIGVCLKDNHAAVIFTDSGKGIPEEIADRIFEPFFTTKPLGEGSGLGLSIVKKIIDKHDGKITAESRPGKTSFCVMIPT